MERKLATALFVDLVDSTALVAGSDPEVVRRRVTGFFDRAAAHIAAYGGTVEKFAGDAVVAVFGVPIAHEDDAERAVRAAVAILETGDGDLPVRIGRGFLHLSRVTFMSKRALYRASPTAI